MGWRIYAASAAGSSHLDKGIPCQDACAFHLEGEALAAVVCDGAGSAARSDVGARLIADALARALGERLAQEPALLAAPRERFFDAAAAAVAQARAALAERADADGRPLGEYAATVVGYVGDAQRGWFVHIGDGIGVAEPAGDGAGAPVVSLPANGEYANETYFVTGEGWREQLRVLEVPAPTARLALMSDGAMPFAMARGNAALYAPFIDPVSRYLATVDPDAGSRALHGTLADPRTHGITSDDKTLLIALRD